MKASVRLPTHFAPARPPPKEEDDARFMNRPCYTFNRSLARSLDDTRCRHCRHYLTSACPHIDEFIDDVEDLTPD
ncbi:MAG TPA: hypothetical protein VGS23_09790 [Thermoplasmata archaeon]|nr:hypothetical protein [Thermoplasmata archaeon]